MIVNPTTIRFERSHQSSIDHRRDHYRWSHYLAFGHLPDARVVWSDVGGQPVFAVGQAEVASGDELLDALADLVTGPGRLGLLLGGGIGSAVLAALVPSNTICFTIAFDAPGSEDDAIAASLYASRWGLRHEIVPVRWRDHLEHTRTLMHSRGGPLHVSEVSLYLAARRAAAYGVDTLLVGTGASSVGAVHAPASFRAGELPYVVDPAGVLEDPVDVSALLASYENSGRLDLPAFRRELVLPGALAAVRHAAGAAGLDVLAPFAQVASAVSADIDLTRGSEPPDIIAEAFTLLDVAGSAPHRGLFTLPADVWLAGWDGPLDRPEFRLDVGDQISHLSGNAAWLLWCLGAHLRSPRTELVAP